MLDADDVEQLVRLGVMKAIEKQPTATESYLLQAGRDYARDRLKAERGRETLRNDHITNDDEGKEVNALDEVVAHPNNPERADQKNFFSRLKKRLSAEQLKVLEMLADGFTAPEIADELGTTGSRTIEREIEGIRKRAKGLDPEIDILIENYIPEPEQTNQPELF
ncbi:MAG: hypothetical protein AB1349_10670 [Elusimicrobiota bacterium]